MSVRDQPARIFWLGGMSGVGKTTAARCLAHRHDLRLYSLDARNYEHAARQPPETRTLDEIWVDMTPEELADWFEDGSRQRFALVLEDLRAIRDQAPIVVEGPQLLPELVAPQLPSADWSLYVVASRAMQEPLVRGRGSGVATRVRDPERAQANRLARDENLARRLRARAAKEGLPVVEVHDVTETLPAIERHMRPLLAEWIDAPHGDVSSRRRDENDARLRQWRAHAHAIETEPTSELDLACECERPGCTLSVTTGLPEAEAARARGTLLIAGAH